MNKYSSLVHHEVVFKKSPTPASWLLGAIWAPGLEGTAQSPVELCLLVCRKLRPLAGKLLRWSMSSVLRKSV